MTVPVIEASGLTKYYGSVRGVEELDLEVRGGEVFGFIGPNGAGKTTTLRMLVDVLRPTAGIVRVLGLDPRVDSVEVRRRVGYLSGDFTAWSRMTAREALTDLAALRGGTGGEAIDGLAGRLGLDLGRQVGKLSKGNRQKVGLVQAFMHEPELLILDEPTGGLDPLVQQEFHRMVGEVVDRGATVFLSSHVLSEVQEVADRAGIIRDGRLVAVEDVASLRARSAQEIEVVFAESVSTVEFEDVPGVRDLAVEGTRMRCRIEGSADPLVKALARHTVESLRADELDLEDLFLEHYTGPGEPS